MSLKPPVAIAALEQCDRTENGVRITDNPAVVNISPIMALGCEAQFKLDNLRYDDRLATHTLTNGGTETSRYRRPWRAEG